MLQIHQAFLPLLVKGAPLCEWGDSSSGSKAPKLVRS